MGRAGAWHRDGSGRTDGVHACYKVVPLCGLDLAVWATTEWLVLLPCCLGLQVSSFTVIPFIPSFDHSFVFLSRCAWKSGQEWCHPPELRQSHPRLLAKVLGGTTTFCCRGRSWVPVLVLIRVFVLAAGGHLWSDAELLTEGCRRVPGWSRQS